MRCELSVLVVGFMKFYPVVCEFCETQSGLDSRPHSKSYFLRNCEFYHKNFAVQCDISFNVRVQNTLWVIVKSQVLFQLHLQRAALLVIFCGRVCRFCAPVVLKLVLVQEQKKLKKFKIHVTFDVSCEAFSAH